METLVFTIFTGYGPASSALRWNTLRVVEALRDLGFNVVYEEVTVPALDYTEFEPFVKVNNMDVYIPTLTVDEYWLIEYFIDNELPRILGTTLGTTMLPLPPLESVASLHM